MIQLSIEELFPEGWDYAWIASDVDGHLGIFTNAGQGPIPTAVLVQRELADETEELIRRLPERGVGEMLVTFPRSDDYISFARRGLFAYDWRDVHRTQGFSHCYELLCRPEVPISITDVSTELAKLAQLVRFDFLRFSNEARVRIDEIAECNP